MKEQAGRFIKIIIFLAIIICGLIVSSMILVPKFYLEDEWATTTTYTEFYNEEDNSLDILFIGSSRGAAAFNPAIIDEDTAKRSYNLCCEQQNLATSYYWLEEALRYQSPSYVVLDTNYLYLNREKDYNLFSEGCVRKALNSMKWSKVKLDAVRYICSVDDEQDILSYVFPVTRFHDRWQELGRKDFVYESNPYKGYAPTYGKVKPESVYKPYTIDNMTGSDLKMDAEMLEYLNKIKSICDNNDINMILASAISDEENPDKSYTTDKWCKDNNATFVDFNQEVNYNAAGLNFYEDNSSGNHANEAGAAKMSHYISNYLR